MSETTKFFNADNCFASRSAGAAGKYKATGPWSGGRLPKARYCKNAILCLLLVQVPNRMQRKGEDHATDHSYFDPACNRHRPCPLACFLRYGAV
jgi:hypothetical protein